MGFRLTNDKLSKLEVKEIPQNEIEQFILNGKIIGFEIIELPSLKEGAILYLELENGKALYFEIRFDEKSLQLKAFYSYIKRRKKKGNK